MPNRKLMRKKPALDYDGEEMLNVVQLVRSVGLSEFYIRMTRAAGYQFKYARKTTKRQFLEWLQAHPGFRSSPDYVAQIAVIGERISKRLRAGHPHPGESLEYYD